MKSACLAAVLTASLLIAGCDNTNSTPTGGGTVTIDAPKSVLGKAVKSAKDTRESISRGGDSRESAVLNAKVRLEQLTESVEAMKGRGQSETVATLVQAAEAKIKKARDLAEKFESSTAADDGTETEQLRQAVKEAEDAVAKAKEKL
ncbi:MAG: hypothetical protein HEQ23_09610 [Tepidisphaera sp.]